MIPELQHLHDRELELLLKAPILVCLLIAGADGNVDRKEVREAIRLANRKYKQSLTPAAQFFKEIARDYEDKLQIILQAYPFESTQRTPLIVEELSELNQLWSKLDAAFSREFYHTLREIAQQVASSSGGWLGMRSIGAEEARYVTLPMIIDPGAS